MSGARILEAMKSTVMGALLMTGALGIGASGCGDGNASASARPTEIPATNFRIIPNTSDTTQPPGQPSAGALLLKYTVKGGDTLPGIARAAKVTAQQIATVNNWPEGTRHVIHPGDIINLPNNAVLPTGVASGEAGGPAAQTTTTTLPPTCYKTYTIVKGDTKPRVARKLKVTVAELDAANVDTKGYRAFRIGLVIKYPVHTKKC